MADANVSNATTPAHLACHPDDPWTRESMASALGARVRICILQSKECPSCGHDLDEVATVEVEGRISGWVTGGLREPDGALLAEVSFGDFDTAVVPVGEVMFLRGSAGGEE